MQIGRGRWVGRIFKWADRGTRSASVFAGALSKADPAKFHEIFTPALRTIQQGWVIPTILIVAPTIIWLRHKTDRSKLDAVHGLLDQIRENTFKNEKFDHEQHARITLFKHVWFCWRRWPFFGGWLIPLERSGFATRKTDAIFRAPDDGEKCEGVAGRAWSRRAKVYVDTLPKLRKKNPPPSDAEFDTYAQKSFCSVKKLRRKPPQARSLCGIPIEVGNKRWGVLVVDSVNETLSHKNAQNTFNQLAQTMSSYLKGV